MFCLNVLLVTWNACKLARGDKCNSTIIIIKSIIGLVESAGQFVWCPTDSKYFHVLELLEYGYVHNILNSFSYRQERIGIRYLWYEHLSDSPLKRSARRGFVPLQKSPFLYMNRSPIRHGFPAQKLSGIL